METIYIASILFAAFLFIAISLHKGFIYQLSKNTSPSSKPKLSLIISARDEEANINSLIDSLEKLNYPNENFEVIIVDDQSSDKTFELVKARISEKPNFRLIKADNKELPGKKGALNIAIVSASYPLIVITDADCLPTKDWLKSIAGALDYGYDFIFGAAPILSGKKLVEKVAAFDSLRISFLTFASAGINIPHSAAARNFAFRKSSFERIGGYKNTSDTISGDDDLLLREAVKNKMIIGTVIDQDSLVYSNPPKTFNDYFNQKKRHLQTSFHYLLKQKLLLISWHIINLLCLLSFIAAFVFPIFFLPFMVKIIYDFFICVKYQKLLGHSFNHIQLFYLQIIYEVLIVINFFNSLNGKVIWK